MAVILPVINQAAVHSSTDRYFFLNLRADASSVEADEDEDEEEKVEAPLVKGLPAEAEGVIVDHREAKPADWRWILSVR